MKVRWLGWAGVEIESDGSSLVVDPLGDPGAVFAPLGEAASGGRLPEVVAPEPGRALAGLVTHLHRDHADGPALAAALEPGAPILEPRSSGGEALENLALVAADAELDATGRERRVVTEWEGAEIGAFKLVALPAVDGLGDPQVSWLVEAEEKRILHLGDTVFHGYWWRFAQRYGPFDVVLVPINGAVVEFPHRQPPSPLAAALDPEQAALVGSLVGARTVVPIHYEGFEVEPWYRSVPDAGGRFLEAAQEFDYDPRILELGGSLEV